MESATVAEIDPDEHVTERVLERLKRIKRLNELDAPQRVLDELRALVVDAEEWARLEGDERARAAVEGVDAALAAEKEVRVAALSVN